MLPLGCGVRKGPPPISSGGALAEFVNCLSESTRLWSASDICMALGLPLLRPPFALGLFSFIMRRVLSAKSLARRLLSSAVAICGSSALPASDELKRSWISGL